MAARARAPRVVIVGCGRIAGGFNEDDETQVLTHVVAYRRAGADVVGCVDADVGVARAFARRWGIARASADLDQMLRDTGPEVASLCTPPEVRVDPLRVLLEAPSVRAVRMPIADALRRIG